MNVRFTEGLLVAVVLLLGANLVAPSSAVRSASAQSSEHVPEVLRAKLIELVAADGQVVAQLYTGEDGSGQLRLRSAGGEVRVKLGPSTDGSSLILMDDNTEPAVWLDAKSHGTSITLAEQGKENRVIVP